jgi:hypothetical protein
MRENGNANCISTVCKPNSFALFACFVVEKEDGYLTSYDLSLRFLATFAVNSS